MSGNWATAFFRSQLSDKDGTVSNTKVLLALIVNHILGWISALVFVYLFISLKNHRDITMTDVVTFIGAVTTFATALCGTLMVIKTGGDALNNRAPNAVGQVQPPEGEAPPTIAQISQ